MTPHHNDINSTKQVHPIQMIGPTMFKIWGASKSFSNYVSIHKEFELGARELVKGSHKNEWY
jgi:hypothetical protein